MAEIDIQDLTAREKAAGQKAARTLRRNIKLELADLKETGVQLKNAGAAVHMRFGQLDAVSIKATSATFIQHYGFEGIKKNEVAMTLKPYNHFNKVLNKGSVLEKLLDEVAAVRLEEVTRNIRF